MKDKKALLLLCCLVVIWGLSFPFNKVGLGYTSPTKFMQLRFLIGTLTMFLVAFFTKNLILPQRRDLPIIVWVSLFQMVLTLNFSNYGLSVTGAGKATFLMYTTSIWLAPLVVILQRKISWLEIVSFCVGMLGIAVLIEPWRFSTEPTVVYIGEGALFLSSLCWSIGILCARYMKWHHSTLQLLPWQLLFGTICTLLYGAIKDVSCLPPTYEPLFWGALLYTGGVSVGVGYGLMILVSKRLPPSFVALGCIFIPVISLTASCLFLGEHLSLPLIIGVIFLTIGSILYILAEKKNTPSKEGETS
ncbi:MAG: DMT family transporter [Verrucomicrobia bacterium]|nr:DMT family transporter [Verrucomicrobiota bacterium]